MQGQGGTIGSFSEPVNIDQGSVSNTSSMDQQTSLNMNPVESRFPSHGTTVTHDIQRFSDWNSGEPRSCLTPQSEINDEGMKMEHGWSSSYTAPNSVSPRSEERRFESAGILLQGRCGVGRSGPQVFQGSSSTHVPQNLNLGAGYSGNNISSGQGTETHGSPNLWTPSRPETGQVYSANASLGSFATSSGSSSYMAEEDNGASGSSLGGWGLSCKRKALEGTSGGSSSCITQAESGMWDVGPSSYDASSSLSLSTPPENSPSVSTPELPNPCFSVSTRSLASDGFTSSSMTQSTNTECPLGNWGRRVDPGHQESTPFSLSSRRGNSPFSDFLNSRSSLAVSANASSARDPPHAMHVSSLSRNLRAFPWNGASGSRSGRSSGSFMSGERGAASVDEPRSLRSIPRNDVDSMFVPSGDMRNMPHDPTSWSLATGSSSSGVSSTSRNGTGSAWIAHHNPSTHSQQQLSEFSPWSLFPSAESEPGGHNGHFPPLSSGASSSSHEAGMPASSGSTSQIHHQPHRRSAFVIERQGDDVLGMPRSLHTLATDIDGRHRLISEIRQVLSAMRRGENLRIEDYMFFDPFIYHGMAEIHDRHRDMRLDVDNMSYEELLALEERIGDVSTGLSEEVIGKLMKHKKYMFIASESASYQEPCCVCQEEYAEGDDLGTLDCGHDFHLDCIKQWLKQKNLCPICKTTALDS